MDTREALQEALHAEPTDQVAWLALADWLEETECRPQAELLRLHRAVQSAVEGHPRQAAVKRIRDLLRAGVRPCVPERTNSIGMRLVLVPPGRFLMGSPPGEPGR